MKTKRLIGPYKLRVFVVTVLLGVFNSAAKAEPYEVCQVDATCGWNERCLVTQEEYGTRQCIPKTHAPLTSAHSCKGTIPPYFYPLDKKEVLADDDGINKTELEDQEWAFVLSLLKRDDTETYRPEDSGDAGYYVHIVDKTCNALWSGFLANY